MNSEFGARLKELREAAGLTQQALASQAGLTASGVAKLEQGRRVPSWDTARALWEALGVDCTAFTDAPPPEPSGEKPRRKRKRKGKE